MSVNLQVMEIGSLDSGGLNVKAQYNPKELQIDKTVPWQKHGKANANGLQLEFTGADPRVMSVELFFDGYEDNNPGKVEGPINTLETLTKVMDETGPAEKRRPHHCVVVWGNASGGYNKFKCVIDTMSTKYTMFSSSGAPLRATVTLKLKEADRVTMAKSEGSAPAAASKDAGGDDGGGE
jgi:hypothetical protein